MGIFLKLKHWQLFSIIWVVPFFLNVFSFSNPVFAIIAFPIGIGIFSFGTLGWIWSIAVDLNLKLPEGIELNIRKFKILFSIPILYIFLILIWLGYTFGGGIAELESVNPKVIAWIIIPFHILSLSMILWGIGFAAKTLKCMELGQMAKFSEYLGEIVLIWFSMIGLWVIQPKLNELAKA